MRRRVGVGDHIKRVEEKKKFESRGQELEAASEEHIQRQLEVFKSKLELFAVEHREEIKKNPVFRQQFQDMCSKVGVETLASHKGFWAQLLGVGDFYYEIAIQAIDVCISSRSQNGGLISMEDLLNRLTKRRGRQGQPISAGDVTQAVSKVACLGNGFQVLRIGHKTMIVSVPCELNRDHSSIIDLAQRNGGRFSISLAMNSLAWSADRVENVLKVLLEESMVWVDNNSPNESEYWFSSLFPSLFE
jgi:ESCRT-II complex subunit VPS22